jgi:hypothetical protein
MEREREKMYTHKQEKLEKMKGKQFYCIYFLISHDEQTQKALNNFTKKYQIQHIRRRREKLYNFHDNAKKILLHI